jgi:putative transcriptional regulator
LSATESLHGHFLVASPHLSDPNFFRSVVLIVQHDSEGAFGLILNRPLSKTVSDVWELIFDEPYECPELICHGGPVEGPLTAVHASVRCGENEIVPGVYFAAARENIAELVKQETDEYRLFAGYAGWGGGQLESEVEAGGWLKTAAKQETIFSDHQEMWKQVIEQIGLEILEPTIRSRHVPRDPATN